MRSALIFPTKSATGSLRRCQRRYQERCRIRYITTQRHENETKTWRQVCEEEYGYPPHGYGNGHGGFGGFGGFDGGLIGKRSDDEEKIRLIGKGSDAEDKISRRSDDVSEESDHADIETSLADHQKKESDQ